jgi:uncharacterized membrane protein YhaH (DUF805 family)
MQFLDRTVNRKTHFVVQLAVFALVFPLGKFGFGLFILTAMMVVGMMRLNDIGWPRLIIAWPIVPVAVIWAADFLNIITMATARDHKASVLLLFVITLIVIGVFPKKDRVTTFRNRLAPFMKPDAPPRPAARTVSTSFDAS